VENGEESVNPERRPDGTEYEKTTSEDVGPVEVSAVLRDAVEQAQAADKSRPSVVGKLMDEAPELVETIADLACNVERSIVREMAGGNRMIEEAMPRKLEGMRKKLAGENPSALEKLLVDRIVVCWLQVQHFEILYARNMKSLPGAQGEHHQKRIDRAHKRYLFATRTLVQIRKMGPAVQINIAEQQVNTTS
jgi:hypothetical protein